MHGVIGVLVKVRLDCKLLPWPIAIKSKSLSEFGRLIGEVSRFEINFFSPLVITNYYRIGMTSRSAVFIIITPLYPRYKSIVECLPHLSFPTLAINVFSLEGKNN